jgi:hypothetical protein
MNSHSPRKILFLAANPKNTAQIRLDEEINKIQNSLDRSQHQTQFDLQQKWAVQPQEIRQAMLRESPQIVHFSGHGVGTGGLAFEDVNGQSKLVSAEALAGLFALFEDTVECVILNACYSEVQATAIAHHIPYVIGMNQAVGDTAARNFAIGFYDALGAGKSIEVAFKFGCNSISLEGSPEHLTPVLKKKSEMPLVFSDPRNREMVPSNSDAQRLLPEQSRWIAEGGQVPLDSPLYVQRPPVEMDCYRAIANPGALVVIKAPQRMGKTSLKSRILHYAESQHQYRALSFSFWEADNEILNSKEQFFQWFLSSIAAELGLENRVTGTWQSFLTHRQNCSRYFEHHILAPLDRPLVLGLDEVDQILDHPQIATDFFSLLRLWYESSRNSETWQKLRLVISVSQEADNISLDANQSPFNVGLMVKLPEFNSAQVEELVRRHNLKWSTTEVHRLMDVVDGHPYLLQIALNSIAQGKLTLDQFCETAPTEAGVYGSHLQRHLKRLEKDPVLKAALQKVIAADNPVMLDSMQQTKLCNLGIGELRGNGVIPLCNLYRRYFSDRL